MSSATMLTAISCGVTAPMSNPIGRVHAGELLEGGEAFAEQLIVDAGDLRAAADEPEVAELERGQVLQRVEVVAMPARDDDRIGRGRQRGLPEPGRNVVDDDRGGKGEPLAIGKGRTVVDDVHLEAGFGGGTGEVIPHVPGAEHVERGRRLERFDEHFHLPAADQARLFGEVVVQVVLGGDGLPGAQGLACLAERVVLVTAAADGPDGAPVGIDQHLRADALRR